VAAEKLTLELPETAVMAEPDRALKVLSELRSMGVRVGIDEFGTVYRSLSYLTRLPSDELKIHGSSIKDLKDGSRQAAVVRATIDLAHSLGLSVVAEAWRMRESWRTCASWAVTQRRLRTGSPNACPQIARSMTDRLHASNIRKPRDGGGRPGSPAADHVSTSLLRSRERSSHP
jgi:predicted signal transduction protein with EAL and GGDEF domain